MDVPHEHGRRSKYAPTINFGHDSRNVFLSTSIDGKGGGRGRISSLGVGEGGVVTHPATQNIIYNKNKKRIEAKSFSEIRKPFAHLASII